MALGSKLKRQIRNYLENHADNVDAVLNSADISSLTGNVDAGGNDINNVGSFDTDEALIIPVYDDLANYDSPGDGDLAYATGNGPQSEGVFAHDGSSWQGPFGSGGGLFEDTDGDGIHEQQEGDGIRSPSVIIDRNSPLKWGQQEDTRIQTSNSNERVNFYVNGKKFLDLAQDGGNSDMRMSVPIRADRIHGISHADYSPQDVRNLSSPSQGWTAYHDGSGSDTEGPAHYNGTDWISTVDGSTIS